MTKTRRLLVWAHCHLPKPGGFERQIVEYAGRMTRKGFAVRLCCGDDVHRDVRAALHKAGVEIVTLTIRELDSVAVFARIAARFRPDLVQYHFGSPTPVHAVVARLLGAKNVMRDHGSRTVLIPPPSGLVDRLKRLRRALIGRAMDLYLPVSAYNGEQIRNEVGVAEDKIRVLHNSIDLERFRPASDLEEKARIRRVLGFPETGPILAYIGQLTEEKGIPDLLAVQQELLAARPELSTIWVGTGPLAEKVAASAGPRTLVLGKRTDVADILRAADLVVAPSLWFEAFSLALAEAAATELPAVASRIGGIPEVVADGETGLLIEPGDRTALREALLRLIDDPDLRRRMGRAGRARVERMFFLDRQIETWIGHVEALFADRSGTAPETRKTRTEISS